MPSKEHIFDALIGSIFRSGRTPKHPLQKSELSGEDYIHQQVELAANQYNRENNINAHGKGYDYSPGQAIGILYLLRRTMRRQPSRGHNMRKSGMTLQVLDDTISDLRNTGE
jgi:hypothetical protein